MKIQERTYHDKTVGYKGDIDDVTNYIETIEDVSEIIKELILRFNDGWSNFKVGRMVDPEDFKMMVSVDFTKGNKWKYIKFKFDDSVRNQLRFE